MMEVKIDRFSFGRGTLTVPRPNRDDILRTGVSTDGLFQSKILNTGDKIFHPFGKAGVFPWFCSTSPKVSCKVVLQ